jgi:hypothetical protein
MILLIYTIDAIKSDVAIELEILAQGTFNMEYAWPKIQTLSVLQYI